MWNQGGQVWNQNGMYGTKTTRFVITGLLNYVIWAHLTLHFYPDKCFDSYQVWGGGVWCNLWYTCGMCDVV